MDPGLLGILGACLFVLRFDYSCLFFGGGLLVEYEQLWVHVGFIFCDCYFIILYSRNGWGS